MKDYKVKVYEEIAGSIIVKAKDKVDAELKADEIINEYSLNELFHSDNNNLNKHQGLQSYASRTTHEIDEIILK